MKMLCRNLSGYLFISAILGDVNGIMATIGDNVNTLQSLSFSREFEHQADVDGFEILTQNKVNPKGMATLFERLKDKNQLSIPKFMSSHPITEDRIAYINKLIKSKSFPFEENPKLKSLFQELKK
jgi:predicted Zn-dependent protease